MSLNSKQSWQLTVLMCMSNQMDIQYVLPEKKKNTKPHVVVVFSFNDAEREQKFTVAAVLYAVCSDTMVMSAWLPFTGSFFSEESDRGRGSFSSNPYEIKKCSILIQPPSRRRNPSGGRSFPRVAG